MQKAGKIFAACAAMFAVLGIASCVCYRIGWIGAGVALTVVAVAVLLAAGPLSELIPSLPKRRDC